MKIQISLIAKFTFAALIILLLFMGLLDSINLKNFRKQMIEYAASNAEEIAEIINQSAFESMMRNDKVSLSGMIDRIAKSENIDHIRLIDHNGTVVFSSNRDEIGAAIGKHADECVMCHDPPGIKSTTVNRSRIVTTRGGKEALGFTKEIHNRPECFSAPCHFHGKDNSVLGFLDISVSLENLRQKSHEYRLQFIML
ncbi:MAG: hypothetical protein HXX17_08495, partial [Geobacteraceae bacterium]|nr:hypothetical protein [Geobacteraceae bacterium]